MVALDYLTWDGEPDILLDRPYEREQNRLNGIMGPSLWKKAWIDGTAMVAISYTLNSTCGPSRMPVDPEQRTRLDYAGNAR
jgi:hypothetical protein